MMTAAWARLINGVTRDDRRARAALVFGLAYLAAWTVLGAWSL